MQDLYKDLEERLQELSNLSSVSNLLVRHVFALPDGRALSLCMSTHEGCGACRPGMSWSCCRRVSPAAAYSRVNSATGRASMHVLFIALVALLQAQLSPVASRRQPWLVCCMTRQAAESISSSRVSLWTLHLVWRRSACCAVPRRRRLVCWQPCMASEHRSQPVCSQVAHLLPCCCAAAHRCRAGAPATGAG